MKLLLLQPPIEDFYETDVRLQPIGLAYLKAAVRKHVPEIDVRIRDLHRGWGRYTLPLPPELSYLEPYYPFPDKSPFSTFHHYYHFGASWEQVARVIQNENPDVVGVSALFTPYYREALRVARIVKESSRAAVVMGGSHVSADPLSILADPNVDFVITGEGETPLVLFLKEWLSRRREWQAVPGLGFKNSDELHVNPPAERPLLDDLPIPDLSDLPPHRYRFHGRPLTFLVTSRGCPHRCSFCSVHTTFGLRYRRTSPENVLRELKARYAEGYRVFDFEDDNLTYYKEEMKDLCRAIIEAFPARALSPPAVGGGAPAINSGGDHELLAMNGISYLSLDRELLRLMKAAGFTRLNLALVSSDTSVLATTKRPHTVAQYVEVVREAVRLEFQVTSYQILGLPFETLESMVQTLSFQARQPVLLGASPFYLTPSSPVARELGWKLTPTDYFKARLTAMSVEGPDFTRDDVYTLFVTTRIVNFLKGTATGERRRLGTSILARLFETGVLSGAVDGRLEPLPRFKPSLFFEVWRRAGMAEPYARLEKIFH